MKFIVSPHIYLRMLVPSDYFSLFTLIDENRNHLKQWLPWLDLVNNVDDCHTFIETAIYRHNALESSSFAVFYEEKMVGIAGFNMYDFPNKLASIGYWLDKDHQGKGIIRASVKTLLDYGFKDQKLNKIEIRCAVGNKKSRTIPEKLGFMFEGEIRQCEWLYDRFVDHAVYSIMATEFR